MKLFKRKQTSSAATDTLAEKIAERFIAKQKMFAEYLNRHMGRYSVKKVAYTLLIICTVFGLYCTYIIFNSFIN